MKDFFLIIKIIKLRKINIENIQLSYNLIDSFINIMWVCFLSVHVMMYKSALHEITLRYLHSSQLMHMMLFSIYLF